VVSHVDPLFASGIDVGVERQRVLDEVTFFLVLAPERNDVPAVGELGTCEVAVGERRRPDVEIRNRQKL